MLRPRADGTWYPWPYFVRRRILGEGLFAQRYVFPGSALVPVSFANLAAERAGFEVRDVENLREHYARTLHQWVNRIEARQTEVVAVSDEATDHTWQLCMAASAWPQGEPSAEPQLWLRRDSARPTKLHLVTLSISSKRCCDGT